MVRCGSLRTKLSELVSLSNLAEQTLKRLNVFVCARFARGGQIPPPLLYIQKRECEVIGGGRSSPAVFPLFKKKKENKKNIVFVFTSNTFSPLRWQPPLPLDAAVTTAAYMGRPRWGSVRTLSRCSPGRAVRVYKSVGRQKTDRQTT